MSIFSQDELRQRAFERAAWVLKHFWEEQKDDANKDARVHSRIFDTLVHESFTSLGISTKGGGHLEHLVPCAMLRDKAFHMYWENKSEIDVAVMLGKFLRTVRITQEEADLIDHKLGLKTRMPPGWNFETGSVMARLEAGHIELTPQK